MSKNRFIRFDQHERSRLAGALRAAMDVYETDARNCEDLSGHERMAKEFRQYGADCQKLLDELEECE